MMRFESLLSMSLALVAALAVGCTPVGGGDGGGDPDPGDVQSVRIEAGSASAQVGEQLQLEAIATYEDGTFTTVTADATWTSADEGIAAFDPDRPGQLEALAAGSVEVVATFGGVPSDPVTIDAVQAGASLVELRVDADGDALALAIGQTAELTATAVYDDGAERDVSAEVVWSVADDAIAGIEGGVLTALRRGASEAIATLGEVEGRLAFDVTCAYPANGTGLGMGQVVPPLRWGNAYNPDGTQFDFGMEAFHCDPEFDGVEAMIVVLGAGWCTACTQYTTQLLNPIAESLVEAGALILYIEAQDYNYNPTGSDFAYRHINEMIGESPGIRVGDGDTFNRDQQASAFIQNQPNVDAFPQVWVVRRSDMRVIADQNLGQYYLPLPDIIADVDADWSNPPPYRPPFVSACDPEDEEVYEPNDSVIDAGFIQPGSFEAGLCTDPAVDFYSVGIQGAWRLTVEFEHAVGDIDMVVWDKRTDQAVVGPDGQALGSFGTANQEVIEYFGPADVQVYGYNNASGRYTLTLEER